MRAAPSAVCRVSARAASAAAWWAVIASLLPGLWRLGVGMIAVIAFYMFATITITSAVLVIFARNPVHSVMWLILAFFNAAGLMVLVGAEFIAMLLVIVYVGAVAVLFLFVVMMLDVDFAELKAEMARYMPLALLIGIVIIMQLSIAFGVWPRRWSRRPSASSQHHRRRGRVGNGRSGAQFCH